MKTFALLGLAAAALMAPALFSAPASAQSVTVSVGQPTYQRTYVRPRPAYRSYATTKRVTVRQGANCRTTTVRTKRANGTVWVRQVRKCN